MLKKPLFFLLFSFSIYAQKDRNIFFGRISDELNVLENAHILNLNTNQATSTDLNGGFKIFAKEKDSLKITSIGYTTQILILKTADFSIKKKQIKLKKESIKLDEIELRNHNLTGNLITDIKLLPKEKEIAKSALDFSNIDFSKKVVLPEDEVKDEKYPDMEKITDPTQQIKGITLLSTSIFTSKKSKKLNQRLRREKQRDQLYYQIISHLGKRFFIQEFKITENKIHHFLDYCEYKQLSELSSKERIFELIEFLNKKSKSYLKIIKENK